MPRVAHLDLLSRWFIQSRNTTEASHLWSRLAAAPHQPQSSRDATPQRTAKRQVQGFLCGMYFGSDAP